MNVSEGYNVFPYVTGQACRTGLHVGCGCGACGVCSVKEAFFTPSVPRMLHPILLSSTLLLLTVGIVMTLASLANREYASHQGLWKQQGLAWPVWSLTVCPQPSHQAPISIQDSISEEGSG